MKIESLENGVRLIPESSFEQEQLKRIKDHNMVSTMTFQDSWEKTGPLLIKFNDPYELPGGR